MSENIRTSVIIPVYNTAPYLRECVESVLSQTQKEIEILLIDDGSEDGSWEMAQEYAARYPFVTAMRQEHLYQGTARNRGLRAARGEFVYFMDSDDAILPELFADCYALCQEKQLDFAMFDARGFRYDENDRELAVPDDIVDRRQMGIEPRIYTGREYWNTFYNRHGLLYVCWLLYIRRSFLLENDLFYEERTYFEDNDWMLRMYLKAQRIYYLPRILHRHRWRRGSNMLEGFTVGLLSGCFRMHRVLLGLHEEEAAANAGQEAAERLHMIEDVITLNTRRFDRLAEITPTEDYLQPLGDFCDSLREGLSAAERGSFAWSVHLSAVARILKAARSWEDPRFYEAHRDLAGSGDLLGLPGWSRNSTVAVFGTGKIGSYYAEILREYAEADCGNLFFADSRREDGTYEGFPLYNAGRLRELSPDIILIASTKFREEMMQSARESCPEACIVPAPREVRFLT